MSRTSEPQALLTWAQIGPTAGCWAAARWQAVRAPGAVEGTPATSCKTRRDVVQGKCPVEGHAHEDRQDGHWTLKLSQLPVERRTRHVSQGRGLCGGASSGGAQRVAHLRVGWKGPFSHLRAWRLSGFFVAISQAGTTFCSKRTIKAAMRPRAGGRRPATQALGPGKSRSSFDPRAPSL